MCDTVAEFAPREGGGPRRLLDFESQSEPDLDMPERAGEYAFRLRRELRHGTRQQGKYRVVSVLLNLTGAEQPTELDLREDDLDGAGIHQRLRQLTLAREDAATTLARIAAGELGRGVLPWIPLMRGGGDEGIIAEWKRLALEEPDARRRGDFGGLALVLAELAGRRPLWKKALEGWEMQVSQQVLEWQAEASTAAELRTGRTFLLRALERRYQAPVPPDIADAVAAADDLNELSRWFDLTYTADSLDAFRAAIKPAIASKNGS